MSFFLPSGSCLGVLGRAGSGKTTLVKTLNGLLRPTSGRISIGGVDSGDYGPELARRVGVAFQMAERQLFEETVFRDIAFALTTVADLGDEEIHERVAASCRALGLDLDLLGDRSPLALSDGEKRKVAIAGVLVNDPAVLVLDEPAAGLDPLSLDDLMRVLENIKRTESRGLVVVSHDMDPFLSLLDYMLVLDKGRAVAFGTPGEACAALGQDPDMREMLPRLALLVHDLREAGKSLKEGRYGVDELADALAREMGGQEGDA